ncbi:hypothetical protein BDM02DRAFT_3108572 [Thelephora ganbajun]|uniref:Uncharacterized protein n=1 Tax=Thelephora ganbajun TaxID=370292 RepID=A0ACB6ZU63_THEGA|nr:hypothetical protein BDM02DRAFT_3108572 [Thelephora ganbajun]
MVNLQSLIVVLPRTRATSIDCRYHCKYPTVKVVSPIEPGYLANLVTNLDGPRCSGAQSA